jgi:hypothetical protein
MAQAKCRIPLGMFYGHSAILEEDLRHATPRTKAEVPVLTNSNIQVGGIYKKLVTCDCYMRNNWKHS